MLANIAALAARIRVLCNRALARLGLGEESFLLVLAVLVGIVAAGAAVGFHLLIVFIRDHLYAGLGPRVDLYGRGLVMLILLPAAGGLAVGIISRFVFGMREGHGVVDVMEAVIRYRGVIRPLSAIEKIITSGLTIGTGGSAGAEGPIVQIGAGIASGIGQLFRIARPHMPLLIGCGSAAGISAIFNAPIGGVFFTLEVILQEFSIRTFTPLVLASVVANVTTKEILTRLYLYGITNERYEAIFALPPWEVSRQAELSWGQMGYFLLLGLLCAVVGVALIRSMHLFERLFARLKFPRFLRPGLGGALLGVLGVIYVVIFGWWLLDRQKPIAFTDYPLPALYSDGYGVVRQLIRTDAPSVAAPDVSRAVALHGFYAQHTPRILLLLLGALCLMKLLATCLTLASGGAGGIIAPSLFLGATAGGFLGLLLWMAGAAVQPGLYALVGMGAVLAAVVHAPLASVLITLELTQDHKIILPAMLACVIATGTARLLFRDSIYTLALRARGVRVGSMADLSLLRRIAVEQVDLEPAVVVHLGDPLQELLDLSERTGAGNFVVVDERGLYTGMVVADDIKTALMQREAVPLLTARDLVRADIPILSIRDDLASVLDIFARHDVDHLPVSVSASGNVIGLISRAGLMHCYQRGLAEST